MFILTLIIIGCGKTTNQTTSNVSTPLTGLLQVSGATIINESSQPVILKGLALTNGVYTEPQLPFSDNKYLLGNSIDDYDYIKTIGANTVRFYLQYSWLDDAVSANFFNYMDSQLAIMASNDIKAILSLHYFGTGGSGGFYDGTQATATQLEDFWLKISSHYKTNETVVGYDLLNEPKCNSNNFQEAELYTIYEGIVAALRLSSDEHIVFISDPVNKFDNPSNATIYNAARSSAFKKLSDSNVVYEFHWYLPIKFTHQTVWNNSYFELGSKYPYTTYAGVEPSGGYRGGWYLETNKINDTAGSWQNYTGSWINLRQHIVSDNGINNAVSLFGASLFCGGTNGDIEIDSITLNCRLASQPSTIWSIVLPNSNFDYATKYTNNNSAAPSDYPANWSIDTNLSPGQYVAELRNDQLYFKESAISSYATWKHRTNKHATYLTVSDNYEYQIQAKVKIQNNTLGQFYAGFEFYEATPTTYDKQYSKSNIESYYASWANSNSVPLYCGEWGVADPSQALGDAYPNAPEHQETWINDIGAILNNNNIHWAYHDYKNYDNLGFGLFDTNSKVEPKQAVQGQF